MTDTPDIPALMQRMGAAARAASAELAASSAAVRADALRRLAALLRANVSTLLAANAPDVQKAEVAGLAAPLVERLKRDGVPVKEGIPELLAFLREQGIPCCVATSTKRPEAEAFLRLSGLLEYFSYIVTSGDVSRSKPDPDIFLLACEKNGTSPGEAIVFEDSQNGVLAAFRAGIPVVCIPDIKEPEPYYAEKAAKVVPSALDVPPLFDLH